MRTSMLRTLQHHFEVDELLHELVRTVDDIVPEAAYEVSERDSLPAAVQRLIYEAIQTQRCWACWLNNDGETWLLIAQLSMPKARERGVPVLQVDVHRENGETSESSYFFPDSRGSWRRLNW